MRAAAAEKRMRKLRGEPTTSDEEAGEPGASSAEEEVQDGDELVSDWEEYGSEEGNVRSAQKEAWGNLLDGMVTPRKGAGTQSGASSNSKRTTSLARGDLADDDLPDVDTVLRQGGKTAKSRLKGKAVQTADDGNTEGSGLDAFLSSKGLPRKQPATSKHDSRTRLHFSAASHSKGKEVIELDSSSDGSATQEESKDEAEAGPPHSKPRVPSKEPVPIKKVPPGWRCNVCCSDVSFVAIITARPS